MKQTILLKFSGELFSLPKNGDQALNTAFINSVVAQIKEISTQANLGIVLGGGNFFRGSIEGKALGLSAFARDEVGMLATVMNGKIMHDLLRSAGVEAQLFSALSMPQIAHEIKSSELEGALRKSVCIFAGGVGTPSFTTDTNAVLRAIHCKADVVWKATKVDGVFSQDPLKNVHAQYFQKISYNDALSKNLEVIDDTALVLCKNYGMPIRIFNLFKDKALLRAFSDEHFGSTIQ
jgi:uridylate kinase